MQGGSPYPARVWGGEVGPSQSHATRLGGALGMGDAAGCSGWHQAVVGTLPGRTHPNTCSTRGPQRVRLAMHRCRPSWRGPSLLPPALCRGQSACRPSLHFLARTDPRLSTWPPRPRLVTFKVTHWDGTGLACFPCVVLDGTKLWWERSPAARTLTRAQRVARNGSALQCTGAGRPGEAHRCCRLPSAGGSQPAAPPSISWHVPIRGFRRGLQGRVL